MSDWYKELDDISKILRTSDAVRCDPEITQLPHRMGYPQRFVIDNGVRFEIDYDKMAQYLFHAGYRKAEDK